MVAESWLIVTISMQSCDLYSTICTSVWKDHFCGFQNRIGKEEQAIESLRTLVESCMFHACQPSHRCHALLHVSVTKHIMSYKGATLTDRPTYPFPFKSTGFNLPWTALGSKTVFVVFVVGILLMLLPNNKKI